MNASRKKSIVAKLGVLTMFLAAALALAACNTTRGVGEDLEEAGDEIKDATN